MTSSLVGSEMCIRDRWCSGRWVLLSSSFSRVVPPLLADDGASSPAQAPVAVSYTHLTLPTICSV
eukprot:2469514-Prorocentrum_lima.AAC.1